MISSPSDHPADGHGAPGAERIEQHSLAFGRLLERLAADERPLVLDLGPAIGPNVSFLAGLPSKLYIADLHQTLASGPKTGGALDRALEHDLPSTGGRPVSVILIWDLLDYLEPEAIAVLGRRLEPYCDTRTLLYALVSIHREQPPAPRRFEIVDEETLAFEDDGGRRASPLYKEAELRRRLERFRVERTFLLRTGMQEYLFTWSPDARPARP